ncbi:proton-conducting transporter membrane subunit [Buchnera aphidicola (Kurisakia onigurumii)]|uniref:NADH-quinone oxidoreductase subunit N n=1 Tax=Buchnera aphidicola TaxID=9 RepID=UPI0031B712DE
MIINALEVTAMLPFFILIFSILFLTLFISLNRNILFVFITSIFSLFISLLSIPFIYFKLPQNISVLFHIDIISINYICMILLISLITCIFSYSWLQSSSYVNKEEFYLLLLLSTLGSIVVAISNHIFSFFLGIELLSLPLLGLIGYDLRCKKSLNSTFKFAILSSLSSIFFLLSIVFLYLSIGSLKINNLINALELHYLKNNLIFLCGNVFFLSSILFKLSIFPFHLWTASVYNGSPMSIFLYLSNISKIALMYFLIQIFSHLYFFNNKKFYFFLQTIIFFSIFLGSIRIIFEKNIKKILGYLSIIQSGYLLSILIINLCFNVINLQIINIYLITYLISNIGIFSVLTLIDIKWNISKINKLSKYKGLFWKDPFLTIMMTIFLLSVAGFPLTIGFIGKLYLLTGIINHNLWILGLGFVFGSVLGILNCFRIITLLYSSLEYASYKINMINTNLIYFLHSIIFLFFVLVIFLGIFPKYLFIFFKF